MQPTTNLLINAARKAAKFLQRDFYELQIVRGVNKVEFIDKSILKVKTILIDELNENFGNIHFADDNTSSKLQEYDLFIEIIDSKINLNHGLPFFATSITHFKLDKNGDLFASSQILHFPALAETYYAEKGLGAWVERYLQSSSGNSQRLRTSENRDLANILIASNHQSDYLSKQSQLRHFGSINYDLVSFLGGKVDIFHYDKINDISSIGLQLMVTEAGGLRISSAQGFTFTNQFLASKLDPKSHRTLFI